MQSRRPKTSKVGDKKQGASSKSSPRFKKDLEGKDTFSYMRKTNEKVTGDRKAPAKRHDDSFRNSFGKNNEELGRGSRSTGPSDKRSDRPTNKFGKPYADKTADKTGKPKTWEKKSAGADRKTGSAAKPAGPKRYETEKGPKTWASRYAADKSNSFEKSVSGTEKPWQKSERSHTDSFAEHKPVYVKGKLKVRPTPSDETQGIRLNRFIANSGVCARREADKLIEAGEIYVNGKVMTDFSYRVQIGDSVKHGNKTLKREKFVYVLLNKPKDFLTTTDDPENRKTVMELVKSASSARLYPVGRLDRNTTGLLLMTNDGELAERLMHPSYLTKKIYQADLDKPFLESDLMKLRTGIMLEDGPIKADDVDIVSPDRKSVGLEIHSGRNRIVRRMFEHLGYNVERLDRVMYAGLTKKDLPRGTWRLLTELEVNTIKHMKK